jgi:hypothetical protein
MSLPYTERAKKVLEMAQGLAAKKGFPAVGTMELFRSLLREAREDPTGPLGRFMEAGRHQRAEERPVQHPEDDL